MAVDKGASSCTPTTAEQIDASQKVLDNKLEKANDGINIIVSKLTELTSTPVKIISSGSTAKSCLCKEDLNLILSQVTELVEDLRSFRTEISSINEGILLFKQQQAKEITDMKKEFDDKLDIIRTKHKKDFKQLKKITNANNQYPRLNNAILHNFFVPSREEWDVCYTDRVAWQINQYLPMLDIPVNKFNIEITHPLRNNAKGQPVVIVRFVNRHIRNDILDNKHILEKFGVYATEHLTRDNVQLLNQARRIVGSNNAWAFNGDLFALVNGKKYSIVEDDDLSILRDAHTKMLAEMKSTGRNRSSTSHTHNNTYNPPRYNSRRNTSQRRPFRRRNFFNDNPYFGHHNLQPLPHGSRM